MLLQFWFFTKLQLYHKKAKTTFFAKIWKTWKIAEWTDLLNRHLSSQKRKLFKMERNQWKVGNLSKGILNPFQTEHFLKLFQIWNGSRRTGKKAFNFANISKKKFVSHHFQFSKFQLQNTSLINDKIYSKYYSPAQFIIEITINFVFCLKQSNFF